MFYGLCLLYVCIYVAVLFMENLDLVIYVLCLNCRDKRKTAKKLKIWRPLCRADTHGKGHIVFFAVRIRTAKQPRAARLCSPGIPAQRTAMPSSHGSEGCARQRNAARQNEFRTAKKCCSAVRNPHGKELLLGKMNSARQRAIARQSSEHTAKQA